MIHILQITSPEDLKQVMLDIKVDPYGIKIMVPKGITRLIRMNSLSNIAANILKQEMLSLGGDAAVARGALTGKVKKTDCLLMGNLAQINRLTSKLSRQPFGLSNLAEELSAALKNYQADDFVLTPGSYRLNLKKRVHIMGIVNLTPDSFSGDGLYRSTIEKIVEHVQGLVKDGADIIDIGGESSRPGAVTVKVKEELGRTIPAIKAIVRRIRVPISIDTSKPEVARQALDNGAVIVNDITGLKDPRMREIVSRYKAGAVIMHMKGNPRTMQQNPAYKSLIEEIIGYLGRAVDSAVSAGIGKDKIVIDPGIGFGKTKEQNLEILKRMEEFKYLGRPILAGPSRKSFLGKILNVPAQMRISGTLSACILAVKNGARILRVHDVKEVKQALEVSEAVSNI